MKLNKILILKTGIFNILYMLYMNSRSNWRTELSWDFVNALNINESKITKDKSAP